MLLEARKKIGKLVLSEAAATPAYDLDASYVIHVAAPAWIDGCHNEEDLLRRSYRNCLAKAKKLGCASVAFPLLSAGNYGYPKAEALRIAVSEISRFLLEEDMTVTLAVFGKEEVQLSGRLFASVQSFIDDNYVHTLSEAEYAGASNVHQRREYMKAVMEECESSAASVPHFQPRKKQKKANLDRFLSNREKSFSQTLLEKIDKIGKKDSEIYKKANISRKHFSKIRSNPDYRPTKNTVIAFAFALEMSLEETQSFLRTAGYALSRSSISDVIVEYFLTNGEYDLYELNEVLFVYDQPLIGNVS